MRLSIAKGFVQTMTRDADALTPERLCICALLQIYGVADPIAEYLKHKYKADALLRSMLSGEVVPVPNPTQDEMRLLTSGTPRMNLYLTTYRTPDLIMSLSLDSSGLYRLAHHRVRSFKGLPPRDGLCIYWADTAPPPDHAAGMPPLFERVVRGGKATQRLFSEVSKDYELRRQLSNCADLESLVATATDTSGISVWHHLTPGRGDFTVDRTSHPYAFTPKSMRPNVRPGPKFRIHILGDIPADTIRDTIGKQPRYFAPSLKGATHADLAVRHRMLLRKLLLLLPTPVLGTLNQDGTVAMYCLHFDGTDVDPAFLQTIKLRIDSVPWLMLPDREHLATPNAQLLRFLRDALLEPPSDEAYNRSHRMDGLKDILREFTGSSNPADLPAFFSEYLQPLSPSECEQVTSL